MNYYADMSTWSDEDLATFIRNTENLIAEYAQGPHPDGWSNKIPDLEDEIKDTRVELEKRHTAKVVDLNH